MLNEMQNSSIQHSQFSIQHYFRVQVAPESGVVNVRPSVVTTTAVVTSVAETLARSTVSGNLTRCHVRPSFVTSTSPPWPTNQHTDDEGAAPARIRVGASTVYCVAQIVPPSIDNCTVRPSITCQRTAGIGDGTTSTLTSARSNA